MLREDAVARGGVRVPFVFGIDRVTGRVTGLPQARGAMDARKP